MLHGELWVGDDGEAVATEAARRFVVAAASAIAARGRFGVALAGGSTPKRMLSLLAQVAAAQPDAVDWARVDVFFSDERCVGPEDAASNYRMAREALLDKVPIDPARVHRIEGELDPVVAARRAEARLAAWAAAGKVLGPFAPLDLVYLGVGPDGHTASLFPFSAALSERHRPVRENWVASMSSWRVTMTWPQLESAKELLVVAVGAEKAGAFARARAAPDPAPSDLRQELPILELRPTAWLVDRAAIVSISD